MTHKIQAPPDEVDDVLWRRMLNTSPHPHRPPKPKAPRFSTKAPPPGYG